MKRALSPATNPAGLTAAAAAIWAAAVMIWHAAHHHGVIDPQVVIAAVAAAAAMYTRFRVTPVADPKDGNGKPLTPLMAPQMTMTTSTYGQEPPWVAELRSRVAALEARQEPVTMQAPTYPQAGGEAQPPAPAAT